MDFLKELFNGQSLSYEQLEAAANVDLNAVGKIVATEVKCSLIANIKFRGKAAK